MRMRNRRDSNETPSKGGNLNLSPFFSQITQIEIPIRKRHSNEILRQKRSQRSEVKEMKASKMRKKLVKFPLLVDENEANESNKRLLAFFFAFPSSKLQHIFQRRASLSLPASTPSLFPIQGERFWEIGFERDSPATKKKY